MSPDDINTRFAYHAPTPEKADLHSDIRRSLRGLADELNLELPEGREKSLAITKLEEVMFWSNAAIARTP